MEYQHVIHPFLPVYDEASQVLILGSLPSVKSREKKFYYGNSQNRFWKVISAIFGEEVPVTIEAKKYLILKNRLALWDTIYSCDIVGSSDSLIKNAEPTNLLPLVQNSRISHIFCNGKTAWTYFNKYQKMLLNIEAKLLPSTSPANAAWSLEKLIDAWKEVYNAAKSGM
ncbi:DNA-deoxyinosine glycosylase [Treponema pectinovorum]|uniref:DNA-deoxyinosine glycosylase n=1 Tax=Treponema pectinovorum TaxID=164 RepID=UPI0011CAC388|nr:DNA-deoxyinosine glycosylase [Treponema pectinovorum]